MILVNAIMFFTITITADHRTKCAKENSGEMLSMESRNKLLEIVMKFGGENMAQKLKTIVEAKNPSEQLALSYEVWHE